MKLLTAAQMRELEQLAIREYGIDSLLLMENAARSFCDVLEAETGSVRDKEIAVFCGPGNNGGDGLAISRHLYNRGAAVTIAAGFDPSALKNDTKKNFDIITRMGLPVLSAAQLQGRRFAIAVDALFGTGFHGEPEGDMRTLIETVNQSGGLIAAVDMPSGTSADDGSAASCCVQADLTVTFGMAKLGQFLYPAKDMAGKVITTDISIPMPVASAFPTPYRTLDAGLAGRLPHRAENAHKGSFGKVLVMAGSPGMSGACAMAAAAVLKTGAGMVTAAVPRPIMETVAASFREMMTLPLPFEGDQLAKTAAGVVLEKLKNQDVLLAGCGLGAAEGTKKALLSVVGSCDKPMVLDADGINLLKGNINIIKNKTAPVILTPHPLEFSRISGHSAEYIRENRVPAAVDFAKTYKVVLVLKGADTVVAHPDGSVYICTQSNSGLATAGSGDVLSGVIASLLAQGAAPGDAANLGVYIHSQAGLAARKRLGAYGMTAGDVLDALPGAVAALAGERLS
ncbi:MAG: NAD(P)H-hydrate dehydratase [Clostridia bacterium]